MIARARTLYWYLYGLSLVSPRFRPHTGWQIFRKHLAAVFAEIGHSANQTAQVFPVRTLIK